MPLGALDFAHPALPTALSAAAVGELASAPAPAPRFASRRAPHFIVVNLLKFDLLNLSLNLLKSVLKYFPMLHTAPHCTLKFS